MPPDKATLKCENRVDRLFGRQASGLAGCTVRHLTKLFKRKVTDDSAEEACESAVNGRTRAKLGVLVDRRICTHPCTDRAHFDQGIDLVSRTIEAFSGLVACEGSRPWPGSDDANAKIPSTKAILKCELGVGRAALKLSAAHDECQIKQATSRFANTEPPFDEDACHTAAENNYDGAVGKLRGCPSCLDPAAVKPLIRMFGDGDNGGIYCASTSGAFLEGF